MSEEKLKESKKYKWSQKKINVAVALSEGVMTQRKIADKFKITETSISLWKREPEFLQKIDELTLAHDKATRAGLLREAYQGLEIKRDKIPEDKTTHLDYTKAIADMQGLNKQKIDVNHSGEITHNEIVSTPDVLEAANNLAKKIAESK
ncbi:MAG: hypothetical protein KAS66_03090 [Candidatus Omnitrophica bacterium]|nr:hypothetical protein [Candidatus Omnitrophota bacterium]